ncbi:PhzF family phenazine biosynthesis protein [Pseudomaricurvus alcaniphilus]|nr:PhzF family phenazine biosynthesis protein [Pseudomaricurvus alcaniphilus]
MITNRYRLMALQYALLDIFADAPFQGTQIPVVVVDEGELSDQQKTAIASEFQQTETVFLELTSVDSRVSVFSGKGKVAFGAHTILAASYIAYERKLTEDKGSYASYKLQQNSEVIDCFIDQADSGPGAIQFSRSLKPVIDRYTPPAGRIAEALQLDEKHIAFSKYRPMVVSIDHPILIVPVTRVEHVLQARPNASVWTELLADTYATEMFLFAPGSITGSSEFHGRLLNPDLARGVFPPIGGVMPEFVAYLAEQENTAPGTHTFSIDRGSEDTRKSVLRVEFDKRPGKSTQCRIGGNVIKMGVGTLLYP